MIITDLTIEDDKFLKTCWGKAQPNRNKMTNWPSMTETILIMSRRSGSVDHDIGQSVSSSPPISETEAVKLKVSEPLSSLGKHLSLKVETSLLKLGQ